MISINENYVVDEQGRKKAVIVSFEEWKQVLDALEELDDIRAYDKSKSFPSDAIGFEQAVSEIREGNME